MEYLIVNVHQDSSLLERAVDFFTEKWNGDRRLYEDAIRHSSSSPTSLPCWYLMMTGEDIVGGCGLIANDFISRQDLTPWVCALFVVEDQRGQGWGGRLLEHARCEAGEMGYSRIYLSTDLEGYYERYGWTYIADGIHPWGESSRIYMHNTLPAHPSLQFLGNPVLETERLILRPFTRDDVQDVFAYASSPAVARYMTWDAHETLEDSFWFIDWARDQVAQDQLGQWALEHKKNGRVIGSIGFSQFDPANSCGTVGYALGIHWWNQGLATEALRRLLRFVFADMELNRIDAVHFLDNPASGRVMEKAGMRCEGILGERVLAKDRFWDVKQYAILRKDWLKSQSE